MSIKFISVLLCIVLLTSGCSAGNNNEPNPIDSPGQSIDSGKQNPENTVPTNPKNDGSDGNGTPAGQDAPPGSEEHTLDISFLKLVDSSHETINELLKSQKEVQLITWSPDSQTVAFSIGNQDWDNQMYIWETGKSEPVAVEGARDRFSEFIWSPDNRYVLADAGTSIVRAGVLVNAEYQVKTADIGYVGQVFWSPDSKWIAVGQVNDNIQPSVAVELSGTVDLCIYPVRMNDKIILARGTADYYYLPQKWDSDGTLTYVQTEIKDGSIGETIEYKLDMKSGLIYYPSGQNFIQSIVNERGSVEITSEMRERFNLFARDYRLVYLPDMEYYESFFDANQYAQSFAYNNFGFAVFYVLEYLRCPERVDTETMQNAIQSLFVAREGYEDMTHQEFRKLAMYEDGYYSPWPEGGLDHNRMFYLLTGLEVQPDRTEGLYITVRSKSYYFIDPGYEPRENEKWLAQKAQEMGVSDLEAAGELIASGEMIDLENKEESETTLYVKLNGQKPEDSNPRFISNKTK